MNNDGLFVTSVDLGVQNVHLMSGEDIIGHVFRLSDVKILRIENPVMPNIGIDPSNNNMRVGLLPLRPYLEKLKSVDVPEANVLYFVEVGDRMGRLYAQYTSDLVIAGPGTLNDILNGK
jgi:hypothetical protein